MAVIHRTRLDLQHLPSGGHVDSRDGVDRSALDGVNGGLLLSAYMRSPSA
jgi:hypothetical protein